MDVASLAGRIGVPPPSLALFLAILAGYPLALLWRALPPSPALRHGYSYLAGLYVMWLGYGELAVLHSTVAVLATWLMLTALPPSLSLPLGWAFNVGYLLVGYYHSVDPDAEDYTLTWTTCHCVLTLRLVGLCFDVSDGQRPDEEKDPDMRDRCLPHAPTLLETLSYSYHFGGVLVGPQYPFRLFESLVNDTLLPVPRPPVAAAAVQCVVTGGVYIALCQLFGAVFPASRILTEQHLTGRPFLLRLLDVTVCTRGFLFKYIGIWKLGEAPNLITGLGYHGKTATGKPRWDGVTSVHIRGLEGATRLRGVIESFNLTTNAWAKTYVYKRLRFLGSRAASQLGAVMFLALWHGPFPGYFYCFAMEFADVQIEAELGPSLEAAAAQIADGIASPALRQALQWVCLAGGWVATALALALGLVPFIQLSTARTMIVFRALYGLPYVPYVLYALYLLLRKARKGAAKKAL